MNIKTKAVASTVTIVGFFVALMLALVPTQSAAAVTVPGAPAFCSATDVTGQAGVVGKAVDISWTPPTSNGGATITRYVVKIKGQSTPVYQTDNDPNFYGPDDNAWRWTSAYTTSSVWQIRAVNSAGFGAWCETAYNSNSNGTSTSPTPSPTPVPARPFIPYSGTNTFLKSSVLSAPHDNTLTTSFRNFMATFPDQVGTNYPLIQGTGTAGGGGWGVPFATSTCSDPVWKFSSGATDSSGGKWPELKTTGFHAPANLSTYITGTTDSPLVVMDTCNHFTVWAAKVTGVTTNVINVGTYGAFEHSSNGLDWRNPLSNDTKNGRSRGVIPDSMVIRKDQMDWAIANKSDLGQTLETFFVETDGSKGFTNPMTGFESGQSGWGAEGWRIAIDPTINLDNRTCTPQALVIAKTLQHYGTYLGDNAGGGTSLKAENESSAHSVWNGSLHKNELSGCISWNDFVVIQPGWVN